jgi:hypothetical protein
MPRGHTSGRQGLVIGPQQPVQGVKPGVPGGALRRSPQLVELGLATHRVCTGGARLPGLVLVRPEGGQIILLQIILYGLELLKYK